MSSPKRSKVIDLKKAAEKREEARWIAPRVESRTGKPQRLRARRRKRRALMFGVCILFAAGVTGSLGVASHMERLAIKNVSVSGAKQLQANAITTAVQKSLSDNRWWIFAKKNIFLYPKNEIENRLSVEFPLIKSVEIYRPALLAQAVVVAVEERQPYAKWCGAQCYVLDESGYIFAEASDAQSPTTPYVFRGGLLPRTDIIGQTFLQGRLNDIAYILSLLKTAGYQPTELTVENEHDFSISLSGTFTLRALFGTGGENIVRDLALALEADSVQGRVDELEYVDMRFGNRVYYKWKGVADVQQENGDQ